MWSIYHIFENPVVCLQIVVISFDMTEEHNQYIAQIRLELNAALHSHADLACFH